MTSWLLQQPRNVIPLSVLCSFWHLCFGRTNRVVYELLTVLRIQNSVVQPIWVIRCEPTKESSSSQIDKIVHEQSQQTWQRPAIFTCTFSLALAAIHFVTFYGQFLSIWNRLRWIAEVILFDFGNFNERKRTTRVRMQYIQHFYDWMSHSGHWTITEKKTCQQLWFDCLACSKLQGTFCILCM